MAKINKDELRRFQDLGLINEQAFRDLAALSLEMRLKRDEEGYSNTQMKNFVQGATCSPRVKAAIVDYFQKKEDHLKKILNDYD